LKTDNEAGLSGYKTPGGLEKGMKKSLDDKPCDNPLLAGIIFSDNVAKDLNTTKYIE